MIILDLSRWGASMRIFGRQLLLDLVLLLIAVLVINQDSTDSVLRATAILFWIQLVFFVRVVNLELLIRYVVFAAMQPKMRTNPLLFGSVNALVLICCEEVWRFVSNGFVFIPLWEATPVLMLVAFGTLSALIFPWIAAFGGLRR